MNTKALALCAIAALAVGLTGCAAPTPEQRIRDAIIADTGGSQSEVILQAIIDGALENVALMCEPAIIDKGRDWVVDTMLDSGFADNPRTVDVMIALAHEECGL